MLLDPIENLVHALHVVRPAGQHGGLAVESHDRHPVLGPELQVLLETIEHAVPLDVDRKGVVDENQIVRPHLDRRRGSAVRARAARHVLAIRDLVEVIDGNFLPVDHQLEVGRREATDRASSRIPRLRFDVDHAHVHRRARHARRAKAAGSRQALLGPQRHSAQHQCSQ